MAVTFKVPKSPSRDIAATDTFMGVDLTNTGANIEGIRSPHAPNMVRLVPGKVRKRMGYYKEVLFGKATNVNFADKTSAREKEIHIGSLDVSTWVKLYDLIKEVSDENIYLEFDYKSTEDFKVLNDDTTVTASEEWEHFSAEISSNSASFSDVSIYSVEPQNIYIKNFSLMKEKDESYEWSPAPKYFVERETTDPVYGVHFLRNGKDGFEGDRVTNTNRALETSSELTEAANDFTYKLGEVPPMGTTIYIEADYTLTSENTNYPYAYIYSNDNFVYFNTPSEEVVHLSVSLPANEYNDKQQVKFTVPSGQTLKIKNFSLMYAKDENYAWSPAPEDNHEKFHISDICDIKPKDYALGSSFSDSHAVSASYQYSKTFTIASASDQPGDFIKLSFDVTTSSGSAGLYRLTLEAVLSPFAQDYVMIKDTTENFSNEHVDAYIQIPSNKNLTGLQVFFFTDASTTVKTNIENLTVKGYSIRDTYFTSPVWHLYHIGKDFYIKGEGIDEFQKVYEDANEHISRSFQLNNKCYIIDGKDIYQYSIESGANVEVINEDNAYIPTVTFAKEPSGGGTSYEALNLLQPGFIEEFQGVASEKTYQLSFKGLDDTTVKAWVLNSNADWIAKTEGTDFSVNRATGKITFTTAPGVSPISGEDNVRIQAYRTVDGYRERITKCTVGTLYGVAGATNRIFLAGNPDHPNWDFYCQMNDPTYFPDLGYSNLGSEQSAIVGYSVVNNYLATFKDGFDQSQSVFVREGDMLVVDEEKKTSEPVFKLINTLQGIGAVAPYSFGYLQTEPLFLTKNGIYAITEQDITGEKYTQNRSFYLNGKLKKEPDLKNAIATVYDDQYVLALNNQLYVLDGLQATRTDKSEPYATRQYAGFYCDDIPATCLWTDDALCFGTNDGKVCRFYTDVDSIESYNDDGKAIYACWETPDLDGKLFYKNKTFRYMAVRLMQAVKTSVKLYSRRFGLWTLNDETSWNFIKGQTSISNMLDFENFDFNLLSFSPDLTERLVHTKLRVKKVDKARFRIENGELDEPFGIFDLALEYIESGNYKG